MTFDDCIDPDIDLPQRVTRLIEFWRDCAGQPMPNDPDLGKTLAIIFMANQLEAVLYCANCNRFITQDRTPDGTTVIFNMIEDEDGDTYWSYGHRDIYDFIDEVNCWLDHCGIHDFDRRINPVEHDVTHHWARMDHDNDERFTLVTGPQPGAFPITRLWL
jgi:hypothetical protein